ncbi:hypothetical protein EYR36_007978 [Pleurotus pulmonarius]|nr:hypothetical protein EYR36_007978 [Pleurotus pulmonarius]
MTQGSEYSLLSEEVGFLHHRNPKGRQEAYTNYWIASLAVASLICSVAILVYIHSHNALSHHGTPADRLEFVSQYIGLDRAIRDPESPPSRPILNFPLVISPINASDPDKAMNHPRNWKSSFGMVYLQERHFTVSESVSMVLQFRTGDFRFEECALIANIPESASPSASGRATALEIWRLEAAEMLRAEEITWNARPRRSALFAHWDVQGGSTLESRRFNCSWGSFHTFEFVTAASDSSVLFLQDPTEHGKGKVNLYQPVQKP